MTESSASAAAGEEKHVILHLKRNEGRTDSKDKWAVFSRHKLNAHTPLN